MIGFPPFNTPPTTDESKIGTHHHRFSEGWTRYIADLVNTVKKTQAAQGSVVAYKTGGTEQVAFDASGGGIQEALTYVAAGGVVSLGPGTFSLSTGLTLTGPVLLQGSGASTILTSTVATLDFLTIANGTANAEVRSMTFKGVVEGETGLQRGLVFDGGNLSTSKDCAIHHCLFTGLDATHGLQWGIEIEGQGQFIHHNTFRHVQGIHSNYGYVIIGGGHYHEIAENEIYFDAGTGRHGIYIGPCSYTNVHDNIIDGGTNVQIQINTYSTQPQSLNNVLARNILTNMEAIPAAEGVYTVGAITVLSGGSGQTATLLTGAAGAGSATIPVTSIAGMTLGQMIRVTRASDGALERMTISGTPALTLPVTRSYGGDTALAFDAGDSVQIIGRADMATRTLIDSNVILNSAGHGIDIARANDTVIAHNFIHGTALNGILVDGSDKTCIWDNVLREVNSDGSPYNAIGVTAATGLFSSNDVEICRNTVTWSVAAYRAAIYVDGAFPQPIRTRILNNDVKTGSFAINDGSGAAASTTLNAVAGTGATSLTLVVPSTTLAAAITSTTATTFTTHGATGFASGQIVQVDSEKMSITSIAGSADPYTFTVVRGVSGTTAATHINGSTVEVVVNNFVRGQVVRVTRASDGSRERMVYLDGTVGTMSVTRSYDGDTALAFVVGDAVSALRTTVEKGNIVDGEAQPESYVTPATFPGYLGSVVIGATGAEVEFTRPDYNYISASSAGGQLILRAGSAASPGYVYMVTGTDLANGLLVNTVGTCLTLRQAPRNGWIGLTNNSATPSIAATTALTSEHWTCNNTGATNLTDFLNGIDGQSLFVLVTTGNTTFVHNAAVLDLLGKANLTPPAGTMLQFTRYGTVWYQV